LITKAESEKPLLNRVGETNKILMLSKDVEMQLRAFFESNYPDFAKKFNSATSHEESLKIYEGLKNHVKTEYKDLYGEDPEGTATYSLTPTQYNSLISATGDEISQQIQTIVNTLSLVKGMTDADQISSQMFNAGVFVFSAAAVATFNLSVSAGMSLLDAGVATIAAAGGAGPVVALVVAVVVLILVPFLYFMFKPAYTFTMLLNETDKTLTWGNDYEVHGKLTGKIDSIPQSNTFSDGTKIVTAGFISGSKRDKALVGCQMGFTFNYDSSTTFAYGVESPLTSIYVDNNCYCEFDVSAETVANDTDSNNVQSSTATKGSFEAIINCANKSGDGAWCLARAIKN